MKIITYSLVSWHWITFLWATGADFTWKTVRGVRDAHTPESWYFRARNECPWPMKENQIPITFSTEAMWTPRLHRMYFRENYQSGDINTTHSFSDLVTAELYNSDKSLVYDMSSFFHTFSWRSVRAAPSLYEIILLYCLSHNLMFRKSQLEEFTLEVMTADGETIKQRMDSTRALTFFNDWDNYNDNEDGPDDSSIEASADET